MPEKSTEVFSEQPEQEAPDKKDPSEVFPYFGNRFLAALTEGPYVEAGGDSALPPENE